MRFVVGVALCAVCAFSAFWVLRLCVFFGPLESLACLPRFDAVLGGDSPDYPQHFSLGHRLSQYLASAALSVFYCRSIWPAQRCPFSSILILSLYIAWASLRQYT